MKLAFCLFKYFPFGGLQRDFIRIAKECVRRGHTVHVFTMEWKGDQDPDLNITIIPAKGVQNHTRRQNFVKRLHALVDHQDYDLIVGFNKMPMLDVYYAADTCYQDKARHQHGAWYQMTPRYHHTVAYEKAVFNPNAKTQILILSQQQKKEFIHYYRTPEDRFHFIPPGISFDRLAPTDSQEIRAKTRKEFNIQGEELLLLMVGSGFKTKGLDRILNGLATLPDDVKIRTKLIVIGQDKEDSFQKIAKNKGLTDRVIFLGGREDVPRFLLAADVLVHPAYNENTGTVLLEALVAGLPVLTTDVCGYAPYVEEAKSGIVLPSPFEQRIYNQELLKMLTSKEDRIKWGQNAMIYAKTADIYSLPERTVDMLEKIGN